MFTSTTPARTFVPKQPRENAGCICVSGQCLVCLNPDGQCHEHNQTRCHRCWRCPECRSSRSTADYWAARAFACASCG